MSSVASSDLAVSVRGLSKSYTITHNDEKHTTVAEALLGMLKSQRRQQSETFWALRDIEFDIAKGDAVGIIGRNGAGKSTLLKILSRITEPTSGQIDLYGRVGSLLEVGTGFHPELTGRENIFLNGAILGMSRREIQKQFDAIVEFAEVEKFLDTPVKRYSSGMYVRLAFAVAAHLNSEILIVDEVLAVGDAAFQKKCFGKMSDVAGAGRTVLFVSHNMSAVTRLCKSAILLERGCLINSGPAQQVATTYLEAGWSISAERDWPDIRKAPGNDIVRLRSARVCNESGQTVDTVNIRRPLGVEIVYEVLTAGYILVPNFHFFNEDGVCLFVAPDTDRAWRQRPRPVGRYVSTAWIPPNLLAEGSLLVGTALSTFDPMVIHFYEQEVVAAHIVDSLDGDSARGDYHGHLPGVVRPLLEWTTEYEAQFQTGHALLANADA